MTELMQSTLCDFFIIKYIKMHTNFLIISITYENKKMIFQLQTIVLFRSGLQATRTNFLIIGLKAFKIPENEALNLLIIGNPLYS